MYDIIIIGGGPAGCSAGLILVKAGKNILIIDDDKGMTKRAWIDNYYGVMGILGSDLVETGKKQVIKYGGKILSDTVLNIEKQDMGFKVFTDTDTFAAEQIILATGMSVELAEKAGIKIKDGTEPRINKIIDVDFTGKTHVKGIWATGVVAGVSAHTIMIAGDGAKVAINILSEINGQRYVDHDIIKA